MSPAALLGVLLLTGGAQQAPPVPPLAVGAAPALAAIAGTSSTPLPQANPRAVHTRLSKATPRLGEPVDYELEVRHAQAEAYSLPTTLTLPPFEVEPRGCRRAAAGAAGGADESITTCTLRLRLFTLGAQDVPTVTLSAATPQGARALDVPGPRVEAVGVIDPQAPTDQLELRDPAPPVPLLLPSWRVVWWALCGLAALVAAWLGWRWWRRRARGAAEPPPPIPPGERFARRLEALSAEQLAAQGRAREHFFRLSEAVREYVGALTGLNALDLTTAELVGELRALADPRFDPEALRGFCEDADLIKFARFPAGGYECEAGLRFGRELLEHSTGGAQQAPPGPPLAPTQPHPAAPPLASDGTPRGKTK